MPTAGPKLPKAEADRPIRFIVRGQLQAETAVGSRGGFSGDDSATTHGPSPVASVRLSAARGTGSEVVLSATPGEHLVRLHIADGPTLTLHPATARDLLLAQTTQRRGAGRGGAAAAEPDEVRLDGADLGWGGETATGRGLRGRGLVGRIVLTAIDVLRGRSKESLSALSARALRDIVDGQVDEGLYPLAPAGALDRLKDKRKVTQPLAQTPHPILVFIHGTFVETSSTFGKLWKGYPREVEALFKHYEGQVYALDHRTVGASPISNALTLAQALPKGARLHLVTHSRGGLVGEVLARLCGQRQLDAEDLRHFAGPAYAQQRADLQALQALVTERDLHVERVVRVACPMRGTLLASGRLDAYLSVLQWLLQLGGAPVLAELVSFLEGVAQQRTRVDEFAGLAAMVPGSAEVNWLNTGTQPVEGRLFVVAGDLLGDSVTGWIKTLLADAFYWGDNDLVVHTRAMYGGTPRAGGARYFLAQGGRSTHFGYFEERPTAEAVLAGLKDPDPRDFRAIGPLSWAGESSVGQRTARRAGESPRGHRPAVFVLPGILGSNLAREGKRVWLGLRLLGGLDRLAYDPDGHDSVAPDGAIGLVYDKLIEYLQGEHDVIEFDFDWRVPIEQEARRLGKAVQAELDARQATNQPVRLLAHSMGGVLARTMQLECPQVWQRMMAHADARFVMLGTPNGGSWAPMQVLSGDDTFGNALAAVGAPFADREARRIMAAMPGFIQLQAELTNPALGLDREDTWRELARRDLEELRARSWWHRSWANGEGQPDGQIAVYEWGVPPQGVLDQAVRLRRRLDEQLKTALPLFAAKTCLVVGRARFTPDGYEWRAEEGFVYLDAENGGDGRVPLAKARLPGVRTWALDSEHGSLPSTKAAFDAFHELLVRGETEKLPLLPTPRGGERPEPVTHVASRPARARRGGLTPGAGEAELLIVGQPDDGARDSGRVRSPALQISVVNGNLAFARRALFVGHYESLSLTGTEKVVDEMIGGNMSRALQLRAGSYPEACGTHQVFINTRTDPERPDGWARPPAAVVVGLGEEGKLRESMLAASMRQAVLSWLQRAAEHRARGQEDGPVEICATLLGSGGMGISAGGAARAIVQGVLDANERVAGTGWPRVRRVELIELYLDRASDAWRDLGVMRTSVEQGFDLDDQIRFGTGPLRRPLDTSYRGADHDFVRVTRDEKSSVLEFALDSRRARTEAREQSTQAVLVDELVATAASDRVIDEQIGKTLFQLLVPPVMEPYFRSTGRILLEVNRHAAAIPWELLDTTEDAGSPPQEPWALRTGLLRKLYLADGDAGGRRDAIADDHILVIGEPALAGRPHYGALPGALREAREVLKKLRESAGDERRAMVDESLQQAARPVINKLLEKRWRIVHITGHGEAGPSGGVVLSGRAFLGPNEFSAMRCVPELVFLNCCHTGSTAPVAASADDPAPPPFVPATFAAGTAEALIRIGVRCVIAAGWAVDDEAACRFAATFYERLLGGANFGTSVAEARRAARASPGSGNTWAAYQCYGDPHWRYQSAVGDAQAPAVSLQDFYAGIASPVGLTLALEQIAAEVAWQRDADPKKLLPRIGHLEGRYGPRWRTIGAVAEAFGVAYQAAGAFDEAIRWFEAAIKCNDASASIKASEKLGNLIGRQAARDVLAKGEAATAADVDAALARAREGLKVLHALTALLPTVERHTLIGSTWKRMALIERAGGRAQDERNSVTMMETAYRAALTLAEENDPSLWDRAATNVVAALIRQHLMVTGNVSKAAQTRPDPALRRRLREALAARADCEPDFWNHAARIELDLYAHLLGEALSPSMPAIVQRYENLQRSAPARSHWRTLGDQLEFVLGGPPKPQGEIAALLRQVKGYSA